MKVSFEWLADYVATELPAAKVADHLTMAGLEVKKLEESAAGVVFETEITTNRPDWLSHVGVAREVYAILGGRFKFPVCAAGNSAKTERTFKIILPDPKYCPYYSAVLLEHVEWAEPPDFIRRRLSACGVRSVNLIVDVTNFVLLELGQPLHAFDAGKLQGSSLSARRARGGETLRAIDGNEYPLTADDIVIADETGPIAIGGIMGGKAAEVTAETRNILIESAFFAPFAVRGTSRRLGLTSESSYRFERRADPLGVDQARDRAVHLIRKFCRVGRVSNVFKSGALPVRNETIFFEPASLKKILGRKISAGKITTYLKRLGLEVTGAARKLKVCAPSFRSDLKRPIDLVEEIARLDGYDRIPETLPTIIPLDPRVDPILALEDEAKEICVGMGLEEVLTYSLIESGPLKNLDYDRRECVYLINPQNQELNVMRPTLLPGLAGVVRHNFNVGESNIQLFEVGNRYLKTSAGRFGGEERMIALALAGEKESGWMERNRPLGFYDLKGMVDELMDRLNVSEREAVPAVHPFFEPGGGIEVRVRGKQIGFYGVASRAVRNIYDLKQPLFFGEFNIETIGAVRSETKTFEPISKFPPSPRDLTVHVSRSTRSADLTAEIQSLGGELVRKISLFDCYEGARLPQGVKSLSFRIHYQAPDRTLQNEEVNKLHFSIIDSLASKFAAKLPQG